MSYQIKSTPFFKRMVSTSKKNGELQRLKEEYERMQEIDERSIEMRMRQVRLKRLFREIEVIRETSMQYKRRRITADRSMKTNEEIRMETFVKAKELGKEYSKMNALVDRCASRLENVASGAAAVSSRIELERKARSERRISYGNDISRMNIQKIALTQRKPSNNNKIIQMEKEELKGLKQKLRNRLMFGNSCSSRNLLKKSKKDGNRKSAKAVLSACSIVDTDNATLVDDQDGQFHLTSDAKGFDLPETSYMNLRQFKDSCKQKNLCELFVDSSATITNRSVEEDGGRTLAKQRWRKLAHIVRHRMEMLRSLNIQLKSFENTNDTEEYELRYIQNNINIPMSQLNVKPSLQNSESDDLLPGEVLLSVESLDRLDRQLLPDRLAPITTVRTKNSDNVDNPKDVRSNVQRYVKMFEPLVRRAARKDVLEFGIEQLRSIFEHQNSN